MARWGFRVGFETQKTMKNKCIRLERAMYGTVQTVSHFFKKMVQNLSNNALILIITIHVDDFAISGKTNRY
jgi:hypothetical protein